MPDSNRSEVVSVNFTRFHRNSKKLPQIGCYQEDICEWIVLASLQVKGDV